MEKREYKHTGKMVSLLGFGLMRLPTVDDDPKNIDYEKAEALVDKAYKAGVNYFDTAHPYHGGMSQAFVGKALKKYPRDSFYLATKLPTFALTKSSDVEEIFEKQLELCGVDYFDFYLMHSLSGERFDFCEKLGVYEKLLNYKKEGKIRNLGFSFHDSPAALRKIVDAHEWDFAQIQLNYYDWEVQDAKGQYDILTSHGIPVVVMEPVRGGMLAKLNDKASSILKSVEPDQSVASWAIRFAASQPNVLTVLSGMTEESQVDDNLATMNNFKPLSEKEIAALNDALGVFRASGAIPCTGCRYCIDCPKGISIFTIFAAYNGYKISGNDFAFNIAYNASLPAEKRADNCIHCNACVKRCPQGISIPERLAEIDKYAKSLLEK